MELPFTNGRCREERWRFIPEITALVVISLLVLCGRADAFEIDTGSEDWKVNWDNSIRYNLGYRVGTQNWAIINNPNLDDGDRNFSSGIVGNRLDLISEFDVTYKKLYGVRLSGAGWYDLAYQSGVQNSSLYTSNTINTYGMQVYGLNSYVKRYYRGPSGELLDAFAFGKFEAGEIPFQIKVGRQTQYWGESLLLNAALNGIAYAQSPLDIAKGYAVPNTSVKELFRPLNNVSVTVHPTQEITLMGQYFMQWEPNRYPETGSYLGIYDIFLQSAQTLVFGPGLYGVFMPDITPRQLGDWGIGARWSPEFLEGGAFGIYYRNFSDKFPQLHVTQDYSVLRWAYASDIQLLGVSYSQQILGVSVGAEFSYRRNMPLQSVPVAVPSLAEFPTTGNTFGARGETMHGLLNFLGLINKTPAFDSASWTVEFNWSHWNNVTQNEAVFKGNPDYLYIDKITKNFLSVDINFTPTWFQVFPGADLSLPLAYSRGLVGNSSTGVLQRNAGSYLVGLSIDYLTRHKFDLTYVGYFGQFYDYGGSVGLINNGDPALLKDRDTLSFTYRYTF